MKHTPCVFFNQGEIPCLLSFYLVLLQITEHCELPFKVVTERDNAPSSVLSFVELCTTTISREAPYMN